MGYEPTEPTRKGAQGFGPVLHARCEGFSKGEYDDYDPMDMSDPRNPFYVDPEIAAAQDAAWKKMIETGEPYDGPKLF